MTLRNQLSHLDCLLFLRIGATFLVLIGHAAAFFKGAQFTQWPNFPYIQSIAVVLFFAVSGWTIAWLLDKRPEGFGRFLFDRYTRLAIPLLPVLVVLAVAQQLFYGDVQPYSENSSTFSFLGNLAFLQNLSINTPIGVIDLGIHPFGLNRPLWTISLEFWIYVGFGGAIYLSRGNPWLSIFIVLTLALLGPSGFSGYGKGLPFVWIVGACLYHAIGKTKVNLSKIAKMALLPVWIYLLYCMFDPSLWPKNGAYSATYSSVILANFAMFMMMTIGLKKNDMVMSIMHWLGGFAYTTYLVHYPMMQILRDTRLFANGIISMFIVAGICLIASWLISIPFEQQYRPIRNWIWAMGARIYYTFDERTRLGS